MATWPGRGGNIGELIRNPRTGTLPGGRSFTPGYEQEQIAITQAGLQEAATRNRFNRIRNLLVELLGGGGAGGGGQMLSFGAGRRGMGGGVVGRAGGDLGQLFSQFMGGAGGASSLSLSDMPRDQRLREMIYGQVQEAYGPEGTFERTPYGRLLQSRAAESTNAAIRDYMARTGGAQTAASAATAAALRGQGATGLAQAGLEARARQRSEVGQLLDYLARSRGLEADLLRTGIEQRGDRFSQLMQLIGTIGGMA